MAQTSIGHKTLWHADFLKIILANFCVCTSLYMFLPVAPVCMGRIPGEDVGGMCASVLLFWGGRMFTCTFLQLLVGCLPAEECGLVGISRHRMRYGGVSFRWPAVGEVAGEDDAGGFI